MTALRPAPALAVSVPTSAPAPVRGGEQAMFTVLLALTFMLPTALIIAPLGQIGIPNLVFGLVLLVCWCLARTTPRLGLDRGRQPMRLVVLVAVLVLLASYASGEVRGLSSLEASGADATLIGQAAMFGVLLFAADAIRDLPGLIRVLQQWVAGCALLGLTGALQFFEVIDLNQVIRVPGLTYHSTEQLDQLSRDGFTRVQGLAGHPIEYGVLLAVALPLALHFALHAAPGRRLRWWVAFGLVAGGLPLSVSRSGVLTAAVTLTLYLVTVRGRTLANLAPLAAFGLGGLSAAIPGLLGSIRGLFAVSTLSNDDSITGRTDDYAMVLAVWQQHPVFGLGPGTFIPKLYTVLDNDYLYTLATQGTAGLLVELALFGSAYALARRARWASTDPYLRGLGQAVAAAVAGLAVASFTFDASGFKMTSVTIYLLFGCSAALWRLTVRARS
jgi:O-antigen ligase